jgi:hypothetical protein
MAPDTPDPQSNQAHTPDAAEHVAEAHRILSGMRQQLDRHPDLEQAISKLEMALSILAIKSGGML